LHWHVEVGFAVVFRLDRHELFEKRGVSLVVERDVERYAFISDGKLDAEFAGRVGNLCDSLDLVKSMFGHSLLSLLEFNFVAVDHKVQDHSLGALVVAAVTQVDGE